VAIVNQTAAKQFWPNEDPVGTMILFGNAETTIVGVVADVRQQLDQPSGPELYVSLQQAALLGTTWLLKTDREVGDVERAIRTEARVLDATLPVSDFRTLAEVRSTTLTPRRVVVALIGLFGLLALVITAAGIAGVVAFSVNQRTQEFGIRMALGAQRGSVLALVLREGVLLVTIGLGLGLVGAAVLTKLVGRLLVATAPNSGPLLFDVPPTDTVTYIGVGAILLLVAIAACLMPARRAASVDPMVALRSQ
jgi:putative ABC transport system permease protein